MKYTMKYPIPFTYTAHGEIYIEAASQEDAELKAQVELVELSEAGDLVSYRGSDIVWDSDEVEVD